MWNLLKRYLSFSRPSQTSLTPCRIFNGLQNRSWTRTAGNRTNPERRALYFTGLPDLPTMKLRCSCQPRRPQKSPRCKPRERESSRLMRLHQMQMALLVPDDSLLCFWCIKNITCFAKCEIFHLGQVLPSNNLFAHFLLQNFRVEFYSEEKELHDHFLSFWLADLSIE